MPEETSEEWFAGLWQLLSQGLRGTTFNSVFAKDGESLLSDELPSVFSEVDLVHFDALVRRDHPLRLSLQVIDFQDLRRRVAPFYSKERGRPSIEPLVMIKLDMLMYRDRLSDRQVIERAGTDIAYHFFLGLGLNDALPDPGSSCPLLAECMAKSPDKMGRTVRKNDSEAEYQQTRQKALTEEYKAVRRTHPATERKQSEMIRQHGCRRTRYRGLLKSRCQMLMTATS